MRDCFAHAVNSEAPLEDFVGEIEEGREEEDGEEGGHCFWAEERRSGRV